MGFGGGGRSRVFGGGVLRVVGLGIVGGILGRLE